MKDLIKCWCSSKHARMYWYVPTVHQSVLHLQSFEWINLSISHALIWLSKASARRTWGNNIKINLKYEESEGLCGIDWFITGRSGEVFLIWWWIKEVDWLTLSYLVRRNNYKTHNWESSSILLLLSVLCVYVFFS